MAKAFQSISELIESRGYLLGFQKKQLLEDLESVETDDERMTFDEEMEDIIDTIFYKLFGKGWNDLSGVEIQDIRDAWKGK